MFRVEWLRDAVDELTELWIEADSPLRQAITEATHALDQELEADPYRRSESRDGDVRITFAHPLAIVFEVDPKQKIVWILHVWRFKQRGA
jgi:hypothetical protein